jgi:hypothetical protein
MSLCFIALNRAFVREHHIRHAAFRLKLKVHCEELAAVSPQHQFGNQRQLIRRRNTDGAAGWQPECTTRFGSRAVELLILAGS